MKIISVEGIVVSSMPYKENSRIINIFTKDMGIIGCISKGSNRLKSKLRVPSEKFSYCNFNLYYKEDGLSTLIDGDVIDYFFNIKENILKISYLAYICELSSSVYRECEDVEIYSLMMSTINKLNTDLNPKVLTNILELKYLNYLGINLNLDECVCCGNSKVVTFSHNKGGYVCSKCRTNEVIFDEKVLKLLRLYYYVDISKITKLDTSNDTANIICNIIDEYYDMYSGIYIKSKKFLREIDI